jgi:hypothetical protein
MTDRLNLDELRAELRAPEIRPFLLAYLALVGGRVSRVARYRERGVSAMTLLDLILNQHILAFEIIEGGTRQSSIVDSLEAPRRTVRDDLARLEEGGLIVRDDEGLPAKATGAMVNGMFESDFRLAARMCEAFQAYRAALRR